MRTEPRSKLKFRKPMGAKNYEGHEHHVDWPCFAQPKIDGVRCVSDGQRFWSKNGKEFPVINLKHLQVPRFPHLVDGELMLDYDADFEEIVSVIKRAGHDESEKLQFNAFDIMTNETYMHRRLELKHLFHYRQTKIFSSGWLRVPTFKLNSERELKKAHEQFIEQGYEGTIVRNAFGLYVSRKTHDLLKWKPLKDAEFPIIDVKEARGKDAGTPIFICDSAGGPFRARPMGSMKQRRQMWRDRKKLIGVPLTVEYQNLTKYGKPRFPRAKVPRDYE